MKCILRKVHTHKSEFELPNSNIGNKVQCLSEVATHSLELISFDNPSKIFFKQIHINLNKDTLPTPGQVLMVDTLTPISVYTELNVSNIQTVKEMDIFNYPNGIKVIPMNMVGVPGKGLAKYWSLKYPSQVKVYKEACINLEFNSKKLLLLEDCLLVPTKDHWKERSTPQMLHATIKGIRDFILDSIDSPTPITEVAIPMIGCGITTGQLNYHQIVKPMLIKELSGLPLKIIIEE